MRRVLAVVLTVTALTTLPATPSPAAADDRGRCPEPVVADGYDETERWARVTLTATGCPARENSRFPLTVRIERSDSGGADGVDKTVYCGPFRSGAEDGTSFSCSMELALTHPAEEEADYSIYVMWPGAEGNEAATFESSCVSDGTHAECGTRDAEPTA
jgi:hypothetical protein